MTLIHYWSTVVKRWRIIGIGVVVAGLATYLIMNLLPPVYQSSALIQVAADSINNQTDYTDLLAGDQLVQTEAQLAVSDPVLRNVTLHYKELTVEQLARQVTATPRPNTQLFEITVQDNSPARAAALANDIATACIAQQALLAHQMNDQSQRRIQQGLDSTHRQIESITDQLASLQQQRGKEVAIASLQAQLNVLQQRYDQWQTVLAQLELIEAQNNNFLVIAQAAQPSTGPIQPQSLPNLLISLLAGVSLGAMLILILTLAGTRVHTQKALVQSLGCPVLATVWRVGASQPHELINPKEYAPNVEAYRILRANIGFASIGRPIHSLVVTSAVPNEGKSTIAANLAILLAKAGKNTLLIDADLRHPTIHRKFGLPSNMLGLSNAALAFSRLPLSLSSVSKSCPFSLEPYMHTVGIPNLRVMPSGPLPPNPPELLNSKVVERLFYFVARCGADIVIFDAPSLLGLSDTSILAAKVDGTLVVVDATRAKRGNLERVKILLSQTGTRVLGCVANKQPRKRGYEAYNTYNDSRSNHRSKSRRPFRREQSVADMNTASIPVPWERQHKPQNEALPSASK